jgi:hypothetical protein
VYIILRFISITASREVPGPEVAIQLIPAPREGRRTPDGVWATHPVRRFSAKVMKPGKVTGGTCVITIRRCREGVMTGERYQAR